MKLCVTGGAGYIGSVVSERLIADGHDVTIIDNLTTGHRCAVPQGARLVEGDVRDAAFLNGALTSDFEGVLHFAALSVVGDSVREPLRYFDNNVGGSITLLEAVRRASIRRFVFSSTAAVYGEPAQLPIDESAATLPTNPYGQTKLFVEKILESSRASWDLRFVALRYFNAGGSTAVLGEDHEPESHLIPVVLDTVLGRRDAFTIFGEDYDTPDGTCIRDYIHVADLADAHVRALRVIDDGFSGALNLGSATPFTVLEVVKTVERVTGKAVPYSIGPRRDGDPAALLASSALAEQVLGWQKAHSTLEEIVRSAYEWRTANPDGYAD